MVLFGRSNLRQGVSQKGSTVCPRLPSYWEGEVSYEHGAAFHNSTARVKWALKWTKQMGRTQGIFIRELQSLSLRSRL
jgi:hypothetical protein